MGSLDSYGPWCGALAAPPYGPFRGAWFGVSGQVCTTITG